MTPIQTILHPTDLSEQAQKAFSFACALARNHGSQVVVLHVLEADLDQGGTARLFWSAANEKVAKPLDKHHLEDKLRQLVKPQPGVFVEYRVVYGNPIEQILACAQETKADLIVMGTHGRSGIGRLFLGSVAEEVLRQALCPVMTIKAPAAVS